MSDKNELAEERTDWAEDRTILANERTFAGWMRTGMASLGIGIALQAVFGEFEPTWLARCAATVFVAIAIVLFWVARRNSAAMVERLNCHTAEPLSGRAFNLISMAFMIGALAVGGVLWVV